MCKNINLQNYRKTSENKTDDRSESNDVKSVSSNDNESEISFSQNSESSDFQPDKNDKK